MSNTTSLSPARALARLSTLKTQYGGSLGPTKLALLNRLRSGPLRTADQVAELHEILCFLHAYPDDEQVFELAQGMLRGFADRPDLQRHRAAFENSGIAGTDLVYPFAASTARWLADRWGDRLTVAWGHDENTAALQTRLPLLTTWSERAVFDEPPLELRPWLDRLRGHETDAGFLVRRSDACTGTTLLGDQLYDELGLTLRLSPGLDTPSRTHARTTRRAVSYQTGPLRTGRPDLLAAANDPPRGVADVSRRDAERLIDLAREAMVTRKRDLYSFAAGDPRDVRMIDCGDGLELACYGVHPDQRLLLDAVYSFLMLRNGVPIGYALASALWRSSEIAYNIFDTYRGAEAGWVYGRILGVMRSLFGVDTFTIYPYQLGHENDEGLASGAWWFYYKMGFRPRDADTAALADREAERVAHRPGYRTAVATLRKLVQANLYFALDTRRSDVIGQIRTDRIVLRATDLLAARFGSDRERGISALAEEAADRLGLRSWRSLPAGERLCWERWAPLVALLPELDGWTRDERHGLADVIRAKGGRRESDFVARFDTHPRLGSALVQLARG
jgi:hypothetical protein